MLDTLAGRTARYAFGGCTQPAHGRIRIDANESFADTAKQVYFLGIRKKPETLKLMRALFSDQLTSERNEGDVTFLKISLGGNKAARASRNGIFSMWL